VGKIKNKNEKMKKKGILKNLCTKIGGMNTRIPCYGNNLNIPILLNKNIFFTFFSPSVFSKLY
jgi:hypothetical protein